MKPPKNIDGQAMSVIGMAFLLLGGANGYMRYIAFVILVVGVLLMAYWYRKANTVKKVEDLDGKAHENPLGFTND